MQQIQTLRKFHFEVVYGCNLRCVGCPISTLLPKVKRTSPELFRECMKNVDVPNIGMFRLFNFGETLLHDNLSGIFEEIKKLPHNIQMVEISTNGQYAHWDDLEEAFKVGVLDSIAVSCDGDGTPESYERLRPPAKWDKLLDFMERVRIMRDKYSPNMRLLTRTICTEPEEQKRWLETLLPLGWTPEFRDWLELPDSVLTQDKKERTKGVCRFLANSEQLYINWNGEVIPCCAHPSAGNWGSIKENKFTEIVAGQKRLDMFKAMSESRETMPVCGPCGVT